jgi:hypothetical protein
VAPAADPHQRMHAELVHGFLPQASGHPPTKRFFA